MTSRAAGFYSVNLNRTRALSVSLCTCVCVCFPPLFEASISTHTKHTVFGKQSRRNYVTIYAVTPQRATHFSPSRRAGFISSSSPGKRTINPSQYTIYGRYIWWKIPHRHMMGVFFLSGIDRRFIDYFIYSIAVGKHRWRICIERAIAMVIYTIKKDDYYSSLLRK